MTEGYLPVCPKHQWGILTGRQAVSKDAASRMRQSPFDREALRMTVTTRRSLCVVYLFFVMYFIMMEG